MKINKKLSTAIVLSLMMGVYGTASAGTNEFLYGATNHGGIPAVYYDNSCYVTKSSASLDVITDNVASGNKYTVKASTAWDSTWEAVYGGFSINGNAENNHVKVNGGEIQLWVLGGFSMGSSTDPVSVSSNIVEISGTTVVHDDVSGGSVQDGNAKDNVAIVTGGTIGADVHGGEVTHQGDATGNMVTINGASATKKAQITGDVYGGYSKNGAVKGNVVGAEDKRATYFTAKNIYGGQGTTGAESNDVYLSVGSEVAENVYGGYTSDGVAESNTVNVAGGTVGDSVYGGYSKNGDATNNEVYMSNDSTAAYVFGGYGNTTANGNIVNLAYSNIVSETVGAGNIQGGYGKTDGAAQNEVTLNNILASGDVYGGYAKNGNAGGKDTNGNSLGNTVTITGGHIGYQYDEENEKYVGVTTPSGSHLGDVYGGYVKEIGNADNNNVVVSGGDIFGGVRGGKANNGTANENTVSVSNSTTNNSVTGGNSANGTADKNVVEITDSTIKGIVYGAWSKTGAQENQVSIADSSILHDVYGGYASDVIAKNNTVTISGDSSVNQLVHGGRVYNSGNAENNSVTITGGTFGIEGSLSNVAGNIYGGRVGGYDNDKKENFGEGDAKGNSVSITGGTINGYVYGGITNEGTAGGTEAGAGNTVSIKGADAANKVTINGRAIGGASNVDAIGNKVGNSVSDAATNFKAGSIYGGLALGNANKNEVYLGQGAEVSYVIGGYSDNYGTAIDNIVNINGSTIATDIVGGYSSRRDVGGNTVTISAGTIGTAGKDDTGNVFGGFTDTGGTVDHYGDAYSNVVNITGGTITGKVVGGKTDDGTAGGTTVDKGNQVNISGGSVGGARGGESSGGPILNNSVEIQGSNTKVNGDVYGGYLYHYGNLVSNNVVTIEDGKITGDVFGAYAKNGTVGYQKSSDGSIRGEGNIVEISGGSISGNVYGGKSENGYANGNKVGAEDAAATNFTAKNVYGGYAGKGVEGNEVHLGQGVLVSGEVYGGNTEKGVANNNIVEISGATNVGKIHGGQSNGIDKDSIANDNIVNIKDSMVGPIVVGGRGFSAKNNSVTIDNSTVKFGGNWVTGGLSIGDDEGTQNNTLTILGASEIDSNVYGGYSNFNSAPSMNNSVSIKGDSTTSKAKVNAVDGGFSWNGIASGNKVGFINEAGDFEAATNFMTRNGYYIIGGTGIAGAHDNEVKLGDGVEANGSVIGGDASTGSVELNKVTISGTAQVKENVYGGKVGYYDDYSGKSDGEGDVEGNSVNVTGGSITGGVYGGHTEKGTANNNSVTISGGEVVGGVYGGESADGTANDNVVNISGTADISTAEVYGGKGTSAGTGNTLNIDTWTGSKTMKSINDFQAINVKDTREITVGDAAGLAEGGVVLSISDKDLDLTTLAKTDPSIVYLTSSGDVDLSTRFDEKSELKDSNGNVSKVNEGLWRAAAKGYGVEASKVEFQIDKTRAFVSVTDDLLAGTFTDNKGNTTSNLNASGEFDLTAGAAAYEKIYGAYDARGNAQVATVNLNTAVDLSTNNSTIYGNNVSAAGNTLNIRATGSKVGGIEYFENMNFYIPKDAAAGDTLLSVNSDVDLSNVKVAAGFHNDTALGYGDKVILINAGTNEVSGLDGVSELKVDDTDFTEYDVMVYQGDAGMNQVESGATTLVAELANMELKENSKILAETIIAGATVISDGSDMLAGAGLDSAVSAIATDLETGAPSGKMSMFGAISGNKSKVHTGSHVDVKGWNMNLGFAKELKNKDGKMIIGPVVEYGRGDYDSYLDNGYHGEGNSHYVGGGVMAKQINDNGNYFEGSLRSGKLTNEFKSTGGSYDHDVTYLAGHIGLGHIQKMNEKNSMDYYAKYFHTHVAGDDIKVSAKGKDLDMTAESMTSARLRVGTRLNHKMSAKSSYYIGFAWQREFSGTAEASLAGKEIASPSMKGNSGFVELGVKLFDSSRYDLDLGGFGSVGKKEGAGFNFNFNWKF